jgi:hypothetical protein
METETETEKEAGSPIGESPPVEDIKVEVVPALPDRVDVVPAPPDGPDWAKLGPEIQAKLDAVQSDLEAYKASVSLGVTDWEHFEVVKWQWEKGPKTSDISSWLGEMISGKTAVPKIIAPFISKPEVQVQQVQVQQPKIVSPSTVAGQNISTKVSSQVLAEARRKASLGDVSELRSLLGRDIKK